MPPTCHTQAQGVDGCRDGVVCGCARQFRTVEQAQAQDKGGAKVSTTVKNQDAADLYERLLTIQHAANLQWPETTRQRRLRDQFRLNTFPPPAATAPRRRHDSAGQTPKP